MIKRRVSADFSALRSRLAPAIRLLAGRRSAVMIVSVLLIAALTAGAAHLKTTSFNRVWAWFTAQDCSACAQHKPQSPTPSASVQPSSAGTFTNFDVTGAGTTALEGTFPVSINASGDVAGIYITAGNVSHGFFRASNGNITPFDVTGAGTSTNQGTFPVSIDADDNITGMYADSSNVYHGFVRNSSGTITPINVSGAGTAGHRGTSPTSINGGVITGTYVTGSDTTTSVWHGFMRAANGTITSPIDVPGAGSGDKQGTQPLSINSAGDITGTYTDSGGTRHGFIYNGSSFTNPIDPPGSVATIPTSIDKAGDITGVFLDSSELMHGFVRTASGTITIVTAPGASTTPPGGGKGIKIDGTVGGSINSSATIAGFYTDNSKAAHGFTYAGGTFTSPIDDAKAGTGAMEGTGTVGINDSGVMTGVYADSSDVFHGFILTPNSGSAAITFTPASLTFAKQAIHTTSAAKSVTVKNTGTGTLNISSILPSASFAVSSKTCGATLAVGKTCKVSVTFTPPSLGAVNGDLTFADNAPGSPQAVPLSGTGIVQTSLMPAKATYAKTKVGVTSAAKKFTLTNNLPSTLSAIAISTTGDFAVSAKTCGTTLAAKGKCTISVTFTPKTTGTRTGQLEVTDSANNSPQTAALTGTGD